MIEQTDKGKCQTRRRIVLVDSDRTAQHWWQPSDNWGDWNMSPLSEAYEILTELGETPE